MTKFFWKQLKKGVERAGPDDNPPLMGSENKPSGPVSEVPRHTWTHSVPGTLYHIKTLSSRCTARRSSGRRKIKMGEDKCSI